MGAPAVARLQTAVDDGRDNVMTLAFAPTRCIRDAGRARRHAFVLPPQRQELSV